MLKTKKCSLDAILDHEYITSWNILDTLQYRSIKRKINQAVPCKYSGRKSIVLSRIRKPVLEKLKKEKYNITIIYGAYGILGSIFIMK